MVVTGEMILQAAALMGVFAGLGATAYKVVQWLERQKAQDAEIAALRQRHEADMEEIEKEQCVICYTLLAVLDGLMQQGANGEVTKAHEKLQKHLNKTAHHWEEG